MLPKPSACGNLWQPTRRRESQEIRQVFLQEKPLGAKHIWVDFVLKCSGLGRKRKQGKEKGFWSQVPGVRADGLRLIALSPSPKSDPCPSLAVDSPAIPFLGAGAGGKLMEGSCSIGALPPATLHGGVGLSLCSESWQGEQGRKGGSGGTFPLGSAGAREQLRSGSGGGCSQRCSR